MNDQWRSRITIEPGKRGGRPCIRGMRITVYDVLSCLAAGMTVSEVLDDFPYLMPEDIQACFAFAAERERSLLVATSGGVERLLSFKVAFGESRFWPQSTSYQHDLMPDKLHAIEVES